MAEKGNSSDSDGPIIQDNVIRIQLRKPSHRKWALRTQNKSPGIRFPTIQLFDCEGNLLLETNDDNISIKISDFHEPALKSSQSLKEKDYRHIINKNLIRKHNSISGEKVYTRVFRKPVEVAENNVEKSVVNDNNSSENIPNIMTTINTPTSNNLLSSRESSPFEGQSEISSYKSSDYENHKSSETNEQNSESNIEDCKQSYVSSVNESNYAWKENDEKGNVYLGLQTSQSFNNELLSANLHENRSNNVLRSKSVALYKPPQNKIYFLNTYLKSLQARRSSNASNPDWLSIHLRQTKDPQEDSYNRSKNIESPKNRLKVSNNVSEAEFNNSPSDVAVKCEMRKRLKMYRRGISEIESRCKSSNIVFRKRRHSVSGAMRITLSSSSESVDEADVVLNRLKRRILKNKIREKRTRTDSNGCGGNGKRIGGASEDWRDAGGGTLVRARLTMGSNISQHSVKGLKGRRARSSGDLCNGEAKETESSVCGSVVGDVMGWNRSLPNHLDGNRHLADYSRVNNNYAEFGTYRSQTKGRGLRYRVSKSGSNAEPVWKLQDPGFDQGYGSERSPEEDYLPPIVPPISLEQYEQELRAVYPFITEDNTFTVVVEKDGRGLGMSVCGGGGLVRIRRLYPPQPAWRTGQLAPRDLLLSANNVPLAGLSTYEALEVLRTASARVELRVCRPPADVVESVTPPEPPTPPARTPHPPVDPLNCHPLHARLSQTTSSATTSSSEGRGRREASPEHHARQDLRLPGLEQPLPVYNIQYGEFDIVMTKVNGSLGFTLRKEDHSALGHYVRALVREPALSDGRIQPGDRIVAVNDTPMSNMSHAEAVAFLRACDSEVRLRLYRDHAATPLSPMSPKDEGPTDSDAPLNRPKPPLRAEAVSMLCDLAARRLTPDAGDSPRSPCLSPRKYRKLTKDNNHYETPNVPPHGYELNNLDIDTLDAPNICQEDIALQKLKKPAFPIDSDEPVSMPAELSSDERFKHSNPAYQSAVLHSSTSESADKDDGLNLKKWKGVALSPDNERKVKTPVEEKPKPADIEVQKENINPAPEKDTIDAEPTIVTVELNRGWNSRLGFSVQSHPDSGQSYISAVYSDSVAARDGRLRRGDVILQVNDENVTSMKTPEVIDLLRILRGSICITVLRPPNLQF